MLLNFVSLLVDVDIQPDWVCFRIFCLLFLFCFYLCDLPIEYCIKYKLCLTVYKILNNLSPEYLTNLVIVYKPLKENLRSGKDNWIINTTHHISKTISHQMCLIWNSLPKSLRSCNQTNVFKKELKTYFFNEAFRDLK